MGKYLTNATIHARKACYAGAVLALFMFSSCDRSPQVEQEEQRFLDSISGISKVKIIRPDTGDVREIQTNFIYDGRRLMKEAKQIKISPEVLIIGGDSIFLEKKDKTLIGYTTVAFPYNTVTTYKVVVGEEQIKVGNFTYTTNLLDQQNEYIIQKGDTRKVLMEKGIPENKIPRIPRVGDKIKI